MARTVTIYSERDIREMNLEYIGKSWKSWILKQSSKWLGWNPTENQYFNQAIESGSDLDFTRNFESLVISDGQSKSVNLIWTVTKFVKKARKCD